MLAGSKEKLTSDYLSLRKFVCAHLEEIATLTKEGPMVASHTNKTTRNKNAQLLSFKLG